MAICRRIFFYEGVDEAQRSLMEREVRRYEVRELLPGRAYITAEEVAGLALEYRGRNFVGEPTAVMMHRSVFEEFGAFNEDLVQIPDLEYWLRFGLHTGIAYVDEPLSCFSIHNGAASAANLALRNFRADRVDQLILLHEYLYNPYFEPVRKLAETEDVLGRCAPTSAAAPSALPCAPRSTAGAATPPGETIGPSGRLAALRRRTSRHPGTR